jgi:hypothetical protein
MQMLPILMALLPAVALAQVPCVNQPTGLPIMHISFTPPTANTDGTPLALPITYSVYLGHALGQETLYKTGLTFSPITLKNLQHGVAYYAYLVTVDAKGQTSVPSNRTCKTFYKK